jgi:ribosome-binding factor A
VVGSEVRIKYNPRLEFVFDETIERGVRLERLLNEIEETDET